MKFRRTYLVVFKVDRSDAPVETHRAAGEVGQVLEAGLPSQGARGAETALLWLDHWRGAVGGIWIDAVDGGNPWMGQQWSVDQKKVCLETFFFYLKDIFFCQKKCLLFLNYKTQFSLCIDSLIDVSFQQPPKKIFGLNWDVVPHISAQIDLTGFDGGGQKILIWEKIQNIDPVFTVYG